MIDEWEVWRTSEEWAEPAILRVLIFRDSER